MPDPDDDLLRHYTDRYDEAGRLQRDLGPIEEARTREILSRYLPDAPARILDVGGGPGAHAGWLAGLGYEVHLVDLVPIHVEQARAVAGIASAEVGDARSLRHPDGGFDAVLLLGPLYHLPERTDRITVVREASRVSRSGALVVAAAITRFASAIDGLGSGFIDDPQFRSIVGEDLATGRHSNPTGDPAYFTTAFFHRPDELASEMSAGGLGDVAVLAVEGISWAAADVAARWADPERRPVVEDLIRRLEREPSLLGASPHLLGVGRTRPAHDEPAP